MSKLAQVDDFCPNTTCADYGKRQGQRQASIVKFGKTKAGRQLSFSVGVRRLWPWTRCADHSDAWPAAGAARQSHAPGAFGAGDRRISGPLRRGFLMFLIAGVDACKGGWISISIDLATGIVSSEVYSSVESLLDRTVRPIALAIDIPIGMTNSGPRQCDRLARDLLGPPRSSSVFPAPIRPALEARNRKEADVISKSIDGRGVGAQAWGLYARIREVDRILRANPLARRFVYEVHPEVSFAAWNGGVPITQPKKSAEGMGIRIELIDGYFGTEARSAVRRSHPPNLVADDDINDAFAALWTAERVHSGSASVIPDPPQVDSLGIEMAIWY
jgi:predicted RNase H-like nuclease